MGTAVVTGSVAAALVAAAAVPGQAAAAAQQRAGHAAAAAPICRAWPVRHLKPRTRLAGKLSRDISRALRGRGDRYSVRMLDPYLGIGCGIDIRQRFFSASVVKAIILAALLRKANAQHRGLTPTEKALARLMITESDNNAASALWVDAGTYRLERFLHLAHMRATVLGPGGAWGWTLLTAHDETLLLWLLMKPNKVLTTTDRRYELRLMSEVIPSQRWGVPAGAPHGFKVHVKNGWAPLNGFAWNINSIGAFTRGNGSQDYSIVVLTAGNPDMAYGVATIEDVAVKIHRDLNPGLRAVVLRSTPNASWNVPDEPVPHWKAVGPKAH
ncbi:MAG TPA: serine hydrolase [Streptosporangiaceae bacterium]